MKLLAKRQTFSLHKLVAPSACGCLVTEEGEGAATEGEVGEAAETEEKEKDEEKEEKESQEGDAAKGRGARGAGLLCLAFVSECLA